MLQLEVMLAVKIVKWITLVRVRYYYKANLLDSLADFLVSGFFGKPDSQVNNRDIRSGHTESHSSQLAIQFGNDLADSLGSASRGWNDVL